MSSIFNLSTAQCRLAFCAVFLSCVFQSAMQLVRLTCVYAVVQQLNHYRAVFVTFFTGVQNMDAARGTMFMPVTGNMTSPPKAVFISHLGVSHFFQGSNPFNPLTQTAVGPCYIFKWFQQICPSFDNFCTKNCHLTFAYSHLVFASEEPAEVFLPEQRRTLLITGVAIGTGGHVPKPWKKMVFS